tara:strand:+ start:2174 stop:3277 length:1104 start_codon:yes stop_codon:yes gene_type:complete
MAAPLQLGMFVMPIHDPEKPMAQCFDEDIDLALKCEELGYTDFWVGEHHTSTYENIVMPEIFLAKVLGMTENMRVGPAPVCLQYHHPMQVANRLAFFDHLSHGRLNLCFGPGAVPTDMEVHGVHPKDMGARVAESVDCIMNIWQSDPPYRFEGQFWDFKIEDHIDEEMGIGALHKPLQQPHPPVYVPSISRASKGLEAAAARGFRFISHHMIHWNVLADQWKTYQRGAESGGRETSPLDWSVSRNIFVGESNEEAKQFARNGSLGKCIEYILELTRRTAPTGVDMWARDENQPTEEVNLDYFMDDVVIAGDPASVTEQLLALREQIGDFGKLVVVAHCWDDRDKWVKSLELLSNEVVPAYNSAIGAN